MDLKTLIIAHSLVSFMVATILYLLYRQFPRFKYTKYWAIGGGFMALASVFHISRLFVPPLVPIICSNGSYFIGFMYIFHGFVVWRNQTIPWKLSLSVILIVWTPFFFISHSVRYIDLRVTLLSLGLTTFSLLIVKTLRDSPARRKNLGIRLSLFIYYMYLFAFSLRLLHIFFVRYDYISFIESTSIRDTSIFLVSILCLIGHGAGCILIMSSQLQNELVIQFDKLFEANQRAENAIQEQRNIISMIAHEFVTPLNTIETSSELILLKNSDYDHSGKTQIERINQASKRLGGLVKNVLDRDWLQGELDYDLIENIDLTKELTNLCSEYDINYQQDYYDSYFICGNRYLLSIAFSCLTSNAIKYSHDRKNVLVSCYKREEEKITIDVSNDGELIPPELRKKIFEKYFRTLQNQEQAGTGLGLYFCREIITRARGTIEILDKDVTTFRVTLPLLKTGMMS